MTYREQVKILKDDLREKTETMEKKGKKLSTTICFCKKSLRKQFNQAIQEQVKSLRILNTFLEHILNNGINQDDTYR